VLADKKKDVSDRDIEALVRGAASRCPERFRLGRFVINSGSSIAATSAVSLDFEDGSRQERVAVGDGPIDASFKAIDKIVDMDLVLEDFALEAVTGGEDAQGEARVRIAIGEKRYNGRGLSTDIIEASIKAYLAAINAAASEAVATGLAAGESDGTRRSA
jgi:2-isopropylmalate synthase